MTKKLLLGFFVLLVTFFVPLNLKAQMTVNSSVTATQMAQALVGTGVQVSNAVINCGAGGFGLFNVTGGNLGMQSGIILTNGSAVNAVGPNSLPSISTNFTPSLPGDPDLNALLFPTPTADACSIEFDVFVSSDTLSFNYIFGSDEYPEFVSFWPVINDLFGLFISGPGIVGQQNIALVPNTGTFVGINTVNCTVNGAYYVCNTPAGTPFGGVCATGCPSNFTGTVTEYDGFTKKLTAKKAVQRCNTYHLKIVIADGNDDVVDSGLFLEAASLSTSGVNVFASVDKTPSGASYPNMVEGCKNGSFCFERAGLTTDTSVVKFLVQGTAINGVDYNSIIDSVIFYPGDTAFCVPIVPISDGINEGLETVIIRVIYTNCSGISYFGDSLILNLQDPLSVQLPADTIICTNPFSVSAQSQGTLPPPSLVCGSSSTAVTGAPSIYTVGNGNNQSALPSFLNGYYHDSRVLMVFSKNDLINAGASTGVIQSLGFNVTQYNSSYPYQNFSIKIGCASSANPSLPSAFVNGLVPVYGPVNFTPTVGWNTLNLNQAFDWDGANGLYIEICYDDTIGSNSDVLQKTLTTLPSVLYAHNDSTIGCSMTFSAPNTIGSSSLRPNIRFGIANPAPLPFVYNWSPASIISAGTNTSAVTVNLNQPTNLVCTISNIPGCVVSDTMLLNFVNASALTVSNDTAICPNTTLNLSAVGGIGYSWYSLNGSNFLGCTVCSNPSISNPIGGINDSIVVVASMQGGCILRDTVFIRTIQAASASVQINTPICINTPTQISFTGTAGPNAVFNWNFASGNAVNMGTNNVGPYNVSWSTAGTYFLGLQINDSGCISSLNPTSVNVLNNLPVNLVLSDDTICQGSSIQVVETNNYPGASYNWNFGAATVLSGSNAGPYQVNYQTKDSISLLISSNGCSSLPVKKHVFVKPLPIAHFDLNDTILCSKQLDTLQFNGSSNLSGGPLQYVWNFGNAVVNSITVNSVYQLSWNNANLQNVYDTIALTLTQDGCSSLPYKQPVIIHPNPVATIVLSQDSVCENASSVADALSSLSNPSGGLVNYNWSFGGLGANPGTNTAGPHTLSTAQNYDSISTLNITLTLTQDGCSSERIDTAFIVVKPQPVASFSVSKNPICSGVPVTFTFNGITNSYNGSSVAYNWNFAGGIASPGSGQGPQTVTFTNSDTLFHSYYPSLSLQQDGCTSALFLDTLSLFPIKKFEVLATPNFCIGQTGYLYSSQTFANYQWSTGSSNDSILVQISGHYVLTITDSNGCIDSNYYDLNIKPAPHANAGIDQEIYAGNYVQLDGSTSYGGNVFNWSPTVQMSASNVASPFVAPTSTIQYILAYTDTTNGCVDRDTVTVFVKECADLIIPNAFSPNQDGADDYFMIMNPDAIYKLEQFTVYNRWGQKVFDTDDKSSQGWDGKFNGRDQEIGVYVYLIIAECGGGKQFKRKGNLTLIR